MIQVVSNVEDTLLIEWIKDNPDLFEFPFLSNSFNMAATSTAHSSLLRSQLLACHTMLLVWHAKRKLRRRLCSLMLSILWCSQLLMLLSSVHQHHGQCFVLLSLIISTKILSQHNQLPQLEMVYSKRFLCVTSKALNPKNEENQKPSDP